MKWETYIEKYGLTRAKEKWKSRRKRMKTKKPKRKKLPPLPKEFPEKIVYIEDPLLKQHGNIVALGVQIRPFGDSEEIHLEFFIEHPDGKVFHREIEVLTNGKYDSGSLVSQRHIKAKLDNIKKRNEDGGQKTDKDQG